MPEAAEGRRLVDPGSVSGSPAEGPRTGLEVTTAYATWSFPLAMVSPKLQLDDDAPVQWPWGTYVLPVSPGRHRLRGWFRWGLFGHAGKAVTELDVPEGALFRVRYAAPKYFVFNKGRWTSEGAVAFPRPSAGWHADPTGRHWLRYWDGSAWTAHVSTNDVVASDPFV